MIIRGASADRHRRGGSTVKIYLNGASTPAFTTTADANGNWSKTIGHLADGTYSYAATATDAAGKYQRGEQRAELHGRHRGAGQAHHRDSADVNNYVNAPMIPRRKR